MESQGSIAYSRINNNDKFSFPYVVGESGKYYRLSREIASGSFGKVFEAWQVTETCHINYDTDNQIIVKVIKMNSNQRQNL